MLTENSRASLPSGSGLRIAIVASRYNAMYADGMLAVPPPTKALARVGQTAPVSDGHVHRLVVTRELYDLGINTQMSPSLAGLPRGLRVHLNPADLDHLGVAAGGQVKVSNARGSVVVPAVADDTVLRWTAWMPFNQPSQGAANQGAAELIDATAPVTDVRIETV